MEQQASILGEPEQPHDEQWRNEVQARLQRYKSRRGRRIEGAFTMRFPFPPPEPEALEEAVPHASDEEIPSTAIAVEVADLEPEPSVAPVIVSEPEPAIIVEPNLEPVEPELIVVAEAAAPPQPENRFEWEEAATEPVAPLPPRPRPRRKVIAFPAPATLTAEPKHRLAEPVAPEQLRILDVPEELEAISATPFLEGLLDAVPARDSRDTTSELLDLPFRLAGTWTRVQAGLLDMAVIGAGFVIFGGAAFAFLPQPIPTKFLALGAGAVCVMLWALYQQLFVVYGGRTPGMRALGIQLRTAKGSPLGLRKRRARVLSFYLSVFSMGMGILWALVDAESLCWHDRMTQTFPTHNE